MTDVLTPEQVAEFKEEADAVGDSHVVALCDSHEALRGQAPPTCATCAKWKRFTANPDASMSVFGKCGHFVTGPHSIENLTQQSFGCNRHEPLPSASAREET